MIEIIRRKKILLVVLLFLISVLSGELYSSYASQGTNNSINGKWSTVNGSVTPLNKGTYNNIMRIDAATIVFNVTGAEGGEPSGSLSYSVTSTANMNITFTTIIPPTVLCSGCTSSFISLKKEQVIYSSAVSQSILTISWSQALLTQNPQTLFLDNFLYTNTFLTNQWTIDRYGTVDATPQTSGGFLWIASSSAIPTQTAHVTASSFNPSPLNTAIETIVKRKLTIGLVPYATKTASATSTLHIGLSSLVTTGTFPGQFPYGSPDASAGNDGCNASANLSDNIGNFYMFADNTGYFEADFCADPSGSKNAYSLYHGDPTLFTVFTIETRGVFCSTCTDNSFASTTWAYYRVYQETKSGAIISASDKNVNVTLPNSGTLAPLLNPTYIFVSQHNSGFTGVVTKIALVDLQNYGSPVLLPPPPSNIPFPTCISCVGIQNLILEAATYIGLGNPQLGAFILWGAITGLTLMFIAVYTKAVIPVSLVGMCLTLMFIFGGFLPTVLAFIMLFGSGVLMAVTFYKVISGGVSSTGGRL